LGKPEIKSFLIIPNKLKIIRKDQKEGPKIKKELIKTLPKIPSFQPNFPTKKAVLITQFL